MSWWCSPAPRALTPAEYGAFACYLSAVVMA